MLNWIRQMRLYKAFVILHSSVTDTFEFKEILCFHSLNCIGIQIAFIFKLKASLTCLLNCRTIFPTFHLMIIYFPDSKYWNSFQRISPFYFLFIKINRNPFFDIFKKTIWYFVFWNFCHHAWFYSYQFVYNFTISRLFFMKTKVLRNWRRLWSISHSNFSFTE